MLTLFFNIIFGVNSSLSQNSLEQVWNVRAFPALLAWRLRLRSSYVIDPITNNRRMMDDPYLRAFTQVSWLKSNKFSELQIVL